MFPVHINFYNIFARFLSVLTNWADYFCILVILLIQIRSNQPETSLNILYPLADVA
ncbi:MAG: hypothetical protein MRERC_4c011 [Mycoplasmataceae bacterium RC_NB112A]|nr:MAG: hypothetical protein MRERC_4c011 [Mycoplasmataceae bacterium RC_NB112A]